MWSFQLPPHLPCQLLQQTLSLPEASGCQAGIPLLPSLPILHPLLCHKRLLTTGCGTEQQLLLQSIRQRPPLANPPASTLLKIPSRARLRRAVRMALPLLLSPRRLQDRWQLPCRAAQKLVAPLLLLRGVWWKWHALQLGLWSQSCTPSPAWLPPNCMVSTPSPVD